jgi:hypothetical protein
MGVFHLLIGSMSWYIFQKEPDEWFTTRVRRSMSQLGVTSGSSTIGIISTCLLMPKSLSHVDELTSTQGVLIRNKSIIILKSRRLDSASLNSPLHASQPQLKYARLDRLSFRRKPQGSHGCPAAQRLICNIFGELIG